MQLFVTDFGISVVLLSSSGKVSGPPAGALALRSATLCG